MMTACSRATALLPSAATINGRFVFVLMVRTSEVSNHGCNAELDCVASQIVFDPLQDRARGWICEAAEVHNIHSVDRYAQLTKATSRSPHAKVRVLLQTGRHTGSYEQLP